MEQLPGWIAFVLFGGGGLVLLWVGVTQYRLQRRLLGHSVPVEVEIVKSEVFSSTSRDTDRRPGRSTSTTTHRPDVRFRYEVDGRTYESDLIYPNVIVRSYASHGAAAEELRPFPVGGRVVGFVDPTIPDKAFLIRDEGGGPKVFIVLGVILPPLAWFVSYYI
jgi:hypothetical protein